MRPVFKPAPANKSSENPDSSSDWEKVRRGYAKELRSELTSFINRIARQQARLDHLTSLLADAKSDNFYQEAAPSWSKFMEGQIQEARNLLHSLEGAYCRLPGYLEEVIRIGADVKGSGRRQGSEERRAQKLAAKVAAKRCSKTLVRSSQNGDEQEAFEAEAKRLQEEADDLRALAALDQAEE